MGGQSCGRARSDPRAARALSRAIKGDVPARLGGRRRLERLLPWAADNKGAVKAAPALWGSGPKFRSPAGCVPPWPGQRDGGTGHSVQTPTVGRWACRLSSQGSRSPRASVLPGFSGGNLAPVGREALKLVPATATNPGWRPENLLEAPPQGRPTPEPAV